MDFNYSMKIQDLKNKAREELRQKLFTLSDKLVINQRAVDIEDIKPQIRDSLDMKLITKFLDSVDSLISQTAEATKDVLMGKRIEFEIDESTIHKTRATHQDAGKNQEVSRQKKAWEKHISKE